MISFGTRRKNENGIDMRCLPTPASRLKPACAAAALMIALAASAATPAYAQSGSTTTTTDNQNAAPAGNADAIPAPSEAPAAPTGFWERSNLLGDMGGLRTLLGDHGVTFSAQETSELYGNFSGGLSKGASYNGATQFGLSVDTDKAFGLKGGTFFVDALQIHGHGITAARLNSLQAVRRQGRPAEPRSGIYHQPVRQHFRKRDVRLARPRCHRPASGRSRLSVVIAWRAPAVQAN